MAPLRFMLVENTLQFKKIERESRKFSFTDVGLLGMDGDTLIYDLKGSTSSNRFTKVGKGESVAGVTWKDHNLLEHKSKFPSLFNVKKADRLFLNKQIKADTEFLASHGLMDYSLLLGVEKSD